MKNRQSEAVKEEKSMQGIVIQFYAISGDWCPTLPGPSEKPYEIFHNCPSQGMKGSYSIYYVGLMDCLPSVDFPILLGCVCMRAELVARGVLCRGVRAAPWEEALGSIHDLIAPSWNWSL